MAQPTPPVSLALATALALTLSGPLGALAQTPRLGEQPPSGAQYQPSSAERNLSDIGKIMQFTQNDPPLRHCWAKWATSPLYAGPKRSMKTGTPAP